MPDVVDVVAVAGLTPTHQDLRERERLLESLETYRRGLSDAPLLRKWSGGPDTARPDSPAAAKDEGQSAPMTFVVSTEEVDRHGDVVMAGGWRLEAYRRNPVFLWAHDYTRPVIGRAAAVWAEADRLLARMDFAPTDFAREVAALYRNGYQQGVSVGFKPLRFEERAAGRHRRLSGPALSGAGTAGGQRGAGAGQPGGIAPGDGAGHRPGGNPGGVKDGYLVGQPQPRATLVVAPTG